MIKRLRSASDGREKELYPTPAGSDLVKKLYPQAGKIARSVWDKMPDTDFEYALTMLKNLEKILDGKI